MRPIVLRDVWDLKINDSKSAMVRITQSENAIGLPNDGDVSMTLYPDSISGYYPISIIASWRRGVDIGNIRPERDYYLNKTATGFDLITDIAPYISPRPRYIKRTALKIEP
jgi:hypothetical protein